MLIILEFRSKYVEIKDSGVNIGIIGVHHFLDNIHVYQKEFCMIGIFCPYISVLK